MACRPQAHFPSPISPRFEWHIMSSTSWQVIGCCISQKELLLDKIQRHTSKKEQTMPICKERRKKNISIYTHLPAIFFIFRAPESIIRWTPVLLVHRTVRTAIVRARTTAIIRARTTAIIRTRTTAIVRTCTTAIIRTCTTSAPYWTRWPPVRTISTPAIASSRTIISVSPLTIIPQCVLNRYHPIQYLTAKRKKQAC